MTRNEDLPVGAASVVAEGYDRLGARYHDLGRRNGWGPRPRYLSLLSAGLRRGATVLDLGCGDGSPVVAALAERHRVVAVDVSLTQLRLVRRAAPSAALLAADMARLGFRPRSFDAVVCLYSLTHVPRAEHLGVLRSVHTWLRPGGTALLAMGAGDHPDALTDDFLGLGVAMFISHFDADTNRGLVEEAGLEVRSCEVVQQVEDGRRVSFCWILAGRPS